MPLTEQVHVNVFNINVYTSICLVDAVECHWLGQQYYDVSVPNVHMALEVCAIIYRKLPFPRYLESIFDV